MFTSIDDFLRYFSSVNRRDMRDVAALPPEADGWRPPVGEGEKSWDINTIIGHMAGARLYFVSAYRGEGWVNPPRPDVSSPDKWLPVLAESEEKLRALLADTPGEWLTRKIDMIDTDARLSGWRILMMMMEHDIHHRSQIDTYSGINGWDPPHIYGRSSEQVATLQQEQVRKYRA
ncbi:MAG: DinB family protein [Dehalococcoidia bacterium]